MSPMIYTALIASISTGTIITMSSHHWLLAWLGLEINTLAMLPIIAKPHHPRATEAATKYFLIQAAASTLILFASTINAWQTGQWTIMPPTTNTTTMLLTTALAIKLGIAPVHSWYPEVLQGSTLPTALIMSTWQKLAPLTLLLLTSNPMSKPLLLLLGLFSALIGAWTGLNQTQTRKIMAFSSIAHMGWLMVALTLSQNLITLTLLIYIIMTAATFTTMIITTTKTLSDLGTTWPHSPTLLATLMVLLLSLSGLPPLTGFMPKWLILKNLALTQALPLATMLALATLPSLFFYLRMAYLTIITTPPNTTTTTNKWQLKMPFTPLLTTLMTSTTLLLPLTPMIYISI
uniref:NADH-ubiquinone oxidoreductase chain 2 n=1 Tax=Saurodactylus mauritanicus TaxID=456485 RepID=J7GBG3_9SAUR|nr:NADH dehydrogenase subunit 2 [Saurodactylus mauritanicus]